MGFLESTQSNPKTIDTFQNIMRELAEEMFSVGSHKFTKFKSISSPIQPSLLDPQTKLWHVGTNEQETERQRQRGKTLMESKASGDLRLWFWVI